MRYKRLSRGIEIELDGFDGLELQRDPSPAYDVVPRGGFGTVAMLVPDRFEAVSRVNYPIWRDDWVIDRTMFEILARHTTTPGDAWFGLWEGYGGLEPYRTGSNYCMGNGPIWFSEEPFRRGTR